MDLSKYYAEICKTPLLTKEEEFDLFMELGDPALSEKDKNKIKDRIVKANLRFVFKTAKKYSKNDPDVFEELICAGNDGLLVGLEKFKPAMNVRFLSYGGWWIQQRILKEMSKMRIVSLPKLMGLTLATA
jgi:DNA-directed RNA polymerase sigma subunit (sigma70/sigma32)